MFNAQNIFVIILFFILNIYDSIDVKYHKDVHLEQQHLREYVLLSKHDIWQVYQKKTMMMARSVPEYTYLYDNQYIIIISLQIQSYLSTVFAVKRYAIFSNLPQMASLFMHYILKTKWVHILS